MDLLLYPTQLRGDVAPPPSKSESLRLIVCAALAEGTSRLEGLAFSDDIRAALSCAEALGARWRETAPGVIELEGAPGRIPDSPPRLDCGESAAVLRFFLPICLALCGGGDFVGHGRLMERPLGPYLELFAERGVSCRLDDDCLRVRGGLRAGEYRLPGDVSSQFFSGLLFALPLLDGPSRLIAATPLQSADYVRMTLAALARAGIAPRGAWGDWLIEPGRCRPFRARPEADWSQAAFWLAARAMGHDLTVNGLDPASLQADRRAGDYAARIAGTGETGLDFSQCPDLLPPLAALAALRPGRCRFAGAARLRYKESDRLRSVAAALRAMGAAVTEEPDGLCVTGRERLPGGAAVDSAGDHRVAMMAALAATRCEKPVLLRGADCVKKTYPEFWEVYQRLGGLCDAVELG